MTNEFKDTIEVRKGEELAVQPLKDFLQEHVVDLTGKELEIEQFGAGHSNLTYLLRVGDWEGVLRRPPHGPVAANAHDMEREYTFLKYIDEFYSAAPKPYVFSDDESIVGSPFFIMERKKGIVLDTKFPDSIKYEPEIGKRLSNLMVDQLVQLHDIDYKKTKLSEISKPDGFMERQVHGWINRYERAKTDEVDGVDKLVTYLQSNIPQNSEATIIHYDYKLNNAMFNDDLDDMIGLFDWEMSTVGDPLADVAVALSYWIQGDDNDLLKYGLGEPPVTVMDGFYTRDEFVQAYAEKSGRDVSNIDYYITFAYFKLAVIGQQIYYRYKQGQTSDPRFAKLNVLVENMLQQALQTIK